MNYVRGLDFQVKSAAWSGIASTLLIDGRTLCSTFALPVPCVSGCSSNLAVESDSAQQLRDCSLVIIDEVSTVPLPAVEAIDNLMRELTGNDVVMGGKVFVFGGDFRQTLPIPQRGTGQSAIDICLKRWEYWGDVQRFELTRNMRADQNAQDFAAFVLSIGNDTIPRREEPPFQGAIALPKENVCPVSDLVGKIFLSYLDNSFLIFK